MSNKGSLISGIPGRAAIQATGGMEFEDGCQVEDHGKAQNGL